MIMGQDSDILLDSLIFDEPNHPIIYTFHNQVAKLESFKKLKDIVFFAQMAD